MVLNLIRLFVKQIFCMKAFNVFLFNCIKLSSNMQQRHFMMLMLQDGFDHFIECQDIIYIGCLWNKVRVGLTGFDGKICTMKMLWTLENGHMGFVSFIFDISFNMNM